MEKASLDDSTREGKRYMAKFRGKTIHFGSSEHDSYPFHKDKERRARYIQRHQKREDWTRSGMTTPGWWAKHVLWSEPTIRESLQAIRRAFNVEVKDLRRNKSP